MGLRNYASIFFVVQSHACIYSADMTAIQDKPTQSKKLKVHRNFKLAPDVDKMLRKRAEFEKRTQTMVVELAIRGRCALKGS